MSSKEDLGSRQPSTDSSGYGSCENTGKQSRLSIQKANSYGGMPGHPLVKSHGSASFSKAGMVTSCHGEGNIQSHFDHISSKGWPDSFPVYFFILFDLKFFKCSENSCYF